MSDDERTASAPGLALAELLQRLSNGSAAPAADPAAAPAAEKGAGPAPVGGEIARFVELALIAGLASGLRSWSRMADVLARELPAIARALVEQPSPSPTSPEARAALVDDLRSRLRALAELPLQESRLLGAELDAIVAAIWPAPAPADGSPRDANGGGPYWRRWEVKP